jgi:hypothetical protein
MEHYDDSKLTGFNTYLDLVNKIKSLEDDAKKSLERGELLPGRRYRKGLRELRDMLRHARDESLRCSSRNPEPL